MPLQRSGRTVTWKDAATGDDAYELTANALADGSKREGSKGDMTRPGQAGKFADLFAVSVQVGNGSAPVAGVVTSFYWAPSKSSTAGDENPGGTTGSDAAWAIDEEALSELIFMGNFVHANQEGPFYGQLSNLAIPYAFGFPLVWNQSGQTLDMCEIYLTELIG